MTAPAGRILVVDDEPSILVTLDAILCRQGYRVATAVSAAQAVSLLATEPFDLVFTDFSLEHQRTGFEVIEFARQSQPGVKVLMFTGYASSDMAEQAASGDVPILYKPLELTGLFATLNELLGETNATTDKGSQEASRIEENFRKTSTGGC